MNSSYVTPNNTLFPGVQVGAEPKFSPLTPYQTADSLPPPVYGLLEEQSDIDATLIDSKSADNGRNYYGRKSGEVSRPLSKKRLSSVLSKNAQSKNWKVPPGAKLIGYNVQMIAGYIPTTYLNNYNHKGDKGRLETQDSEEAYSEYVPGYNMNTIKNYKFNQKSDEMDIVTVQADSLEDDTDNELLHTNFTLMEDRFLEKREEFVNTDATSTTVGVAHLNGFLWPVVETEAKPEGQEEESIFPGEVDPSIIENNKKIGATTTIGPIEHDLSVVQKNTDVTTPVKPDSRDKRDRLDDPVLIFQSTITTSSARSKASENERENLEKSQFVIPQKANSSIKNGYNDEMVKNSTSVLEVPQFQGGAGEIGEEIPFFQQFTAPKPQMNHTGGQTTLMVKEPPKIKVSQTSSGTSLPTIIQKTTVNIGLVEQSSTNKNQPAVDTIIQITEPNEHERAVIDIKELSDIRVTNSTNAQNSISNAVTMPRTMNVDSSEFDDEDYDKGRQNEDDNSFPKLENPDEFSEMQTADEQRRETNEERDPESDSRDVNGNSRHRKPLQDARSPENDRNGGDEWWPQNSSGEDTSSKNKGNIRDDYDEKGNDDDDDNRDDDNVDDVNDDDNDDYGDDGDNSSKMIGESDDEMSRLQENSEKKQGRVDTPIFSPEQIPTFEEWLSSLPIQPAFPFNARNGIRNQPPADPIHFSFPRPFRGGSKGKESKQKEQHLTTDSKKQQKDRMYDYDDSEDEDKGQFQEQRFTLPRNVPYE
ncbi:hypothetical protein WUBG_06041 [Wuchereria bancrofti]|uniref:Uncharacterized protein n=1 Tax=Wuchereria bancrofti TaxID=6293 RepID=J9F0U5_WUCBA|nr:hypothetical protein WUBG_06041 [Wuchereria bancrofti]VDM08661.1 unnamed protein product [Wuchereria bancrofti]